MIRGKGLWLVLGLVLALSVPGFANDWVVPGTPTATSAIWTFHNLTGMDVTGIHIEFEEEVTIVSRFDVGGILMALGPQAGMAFDYYGEGGLVSEGSILFEWEPATAVPALVMWMNGAQPVGQPYFTTIAKLGYLFGQGIVHVRETNPDALTAAFAQFFADNADYLAGLSASLGMDLASSLMPIIMSSPAEGIENFFTTIIGMLGVTTLDEVVGGDVNFGALFGLLGL
jgi:hypothetical protein